MGVNDVEMPLDGKLFDRKGGSRDRNYILSVERKDRMRDLRRDQRGNIRAARRNDMNVMPALMQCARQGQNMSFGTADAHTR